MGFRVPVDGRSSNGAHLSSGLLGVVAALSNSVAALLADAARTTTPSSWFAGLQEEGAGTAQR